MFEKPSRFLLFMIFAVGFASAAQAQRKVTEEAQLFQKLRDGVFTVYGDAGHGSGFLIDQGGLILTNQHVISNSSHIRVQFDDSTKVAAKVISEDSKRDVAILLVSPTTVAGRPSLKLVPKREQIAFEGEKVIAIGSPLHQTKYLTVGIVSKVEKDAILSDVNINPGNSGGPLINMDGEVIALTTFLERSDHGGAGVAGSVIVTEGDILIDSARNVARRIAPPDNALLPVMSHEVFPTFALEEAALDKRRDVDSYDLSRFTSTGDYDVQFLTPSFLYRREKQYELAISEKRKEREAKGNAGSDESYNAFEDLKGWAQYAGAYSPVVIVSVYPKVGETGGSVFGNLLGTALLGFAYHGTHVYEFKADLKDFNLIIDGHDELEIERGMTFVPLSFMKEGLFSDAKGEDLARAGQFTFSPEEFAPKGDAFPKVSIELTSVDKPTERIKVQIPQRTIERVWLDFLPYRQQQIADTQPLLIGQ